MKKKRKPRNNGLIERAKECLSFVILILFLASPVIIGIAFAVVEFAAYWRVAFGGF